MDELVIDEKKYISSKQAAKATGYAKDYIGQLCREGRVPARLVGRSWYVLESAIQDHRFGDIKESSKETEKEKEFRSWESPKYTASPTELLPSINRLHETKSVSVPELLSEGPQQSLQETWQAWFQKFEGIVENTSIEDNTHKEEGSTVIPEEVSIETPVPIRAIHHPQYDPLPAFSEQPVPVHEKEELEPEIAVRRPYSTRSSLRAIQIFGALASVGALTLALLGSGYLDAYIVSDKTVSSVAGIILYNK